MNKFKYISITLLLLSLATSAFSAGVSISESAIADPKANISTEETTQPDNPIFGWNLFQGNFSHIKEAWYNPEYRIHIGDVINIRLWGAFEFAQDMPVDSQGNIFIPKVGNVLVQGVQNSKLIEVIRKKIKTVYRNKVYVYANVANYQPITVFVSGNVKKPGLYQGMSSDSVLQFLDKAKGINPDYGSYRKIEILRNNKVIQKIDLYQFLTGGNFKLFQFQSGDVITVKDVGHRIIVTGDVKRPYRFEFLSEKISLSELMELAIPNSTATNLTISKWSQDNKKSIQTIPLSGNDLVEIKSGNVVDVFPDFTTSMNQITISGEHDGLHTMIVKRDLTYGELIQKLKLNTRSDITSAQLFRKSIARKQKDLLLANLKELEKQILTTPSITREESLMRAQETKGILAFIERAKEVEPKGQIVINEKTDPNDIYLEDGDTIFIPTKNNLILVQGEVSFPGAHTYVENLNITDYIALSGDMNDRADDEKILIIRQNGHVSKYEYGRKLKNLKVMRGDSILILPEMKGRSLQIAKDLTQIMYHIAVSAGVILAL